MDVWKSATTISGEQYAMILGEVLMLEWLADSWDSLQKVQYLLAIKNCTHVMACPHTNIISLSEFAGCKNSVAP